MDNAGAHSQGRRTYLGPMKRRYWKLLIPALLLPVLLAGALQWWVSARFTPQAICERIEAQRNCRASIGSASVRLLGFPARLEIRDVEITPRDPGLKPAVAGETYIKAGHVMLEVNLLSLLFGELDVQRALVSGVDMRTVKWAEGGNSLRLLLAAPGTLALPPVEPLSLEDADEIPVPAGEGPAGADRAWHLSELPVSATLGEARISNANWSIHNHRRGTTTQIKDCTVVLTDMKLDPARPSAGGTAAVSANTRLILGNEALETRTVDFLIGLDGKYQLFDPQTGFLSNDLDFALTLKKGSLLNRLPTLVKLNERLAKLKDSAGLDLSLPAEAMLISDAVIRAHLKDDVIRFQEEVLFPFDTWQLGLNRESWLNSRTGEHEFNGKLTAGAETSRKATAGLRAFLDKQSRELTDLVFQTVVSKVVNPQGNVELPFQSGGLIGRPDVTVSDALGDALRKAAAETGKDLIRDALEGGNKIEGLIDSLRDRPEKPAKDDR